LETNLSPGTAKRRFLIKWLLIAFSLVSLYFFAFTYLIDRRPFVEWTLIKGGPEEEKAQAQLIKMPDGKIILINAGDAEGSLLFFLKKQKIKDIDVIVLSSNTSLSTSGLNGMFKAGIRIKEFWTNPLVFPNPNWATILELIQTKSIPIRFLRPGGALYQSEVSQLAVVSLARDSLALKLTHGSNKVLLILSEASSLKSENLHLGCELFPVDILLDYTEGVGKQKAWESCAVASNNLGKQKGTFKLLLKGDSYRWKRSR